MIDELSPSVVDALLALAGDRSEWDYVFRNRSGGPFIPDNIDHAFRRHLAAAGIQPVGFHALRHTCATLMLAAGVNVKAVQARMRHASIQTTLDTYGHLLPGAFEGMGARLEAWLQGRKGEETPIIKGKVSASSRPPQRSSEFPP